PSFEALSYTWGDPHDAVPIKVEGHQFTVTRNLHCALKYLRLQNRTRVLWVDALCMNQGNQSERQSQVTQMHRIYKSSTTVVAFLGDAWERCDVIMEYM
ncbi:hypothetical protein CC86DRAFT_276641, partial [Ophiobolus disseminans]